MYKKVINKLLRFFELKSVLTNERVVYLTFDDGPEPDITEFVLDELNKYDFKATFFCRGDNAEKYPRLLAMINSGGHAIGNHTYSHLHAYRVPTKAYIDEVYKADSLLHTQLFRPPHGCLTIRTWCKLRNRTIVFWSLNSGDSAMEKFNYDQSINSLKSATKAGDIVLFHFCHKHEKETRLLLPAYIKWLVENGYKCSVIKK